ncbi:MAG: tetratricopeptide repeat protein [Chitinophagaceae bacterium]|nr:tetratricopeptide repeat protein [Chitinophagaceae bacterium]
MHTWHIKTPLRKTLKCESALPAWKIFAAQKNPDVYMEHFMKAYEADSTYAPVLEELYNHYYSRDVRQAKKYLDKFIVNTDYSLQNSYNMTDMLYLNGEYQAAIKSASDIFRNGQIKVQARLYKLVAYSYAKSGDSSNALEYIKKYFENEVPSKLIPADFLFYAQLLKMKPGQEETAIDYYSTAFDLDSIKSNKAECAVAIAELYKKTGSYSKQAAWLGKLYKVKGKTNNVDLFNWGIAWYKAKDFPRMDSVFAIYTERYPDNIFGYYWRAQANAAIDTGMAGHLAIPYYNKVVEIGEKDKASNRKMLLKAYGYLGGYEANITKTIRPHWPGLKNIMQWR